MRILVDGIGSQACNSSQSANGKSAIVHHRTANERPAIASLHFLREVGVFALQNVTRPPLWQTTAEVAPYLAEYGYAVADQGTWKTSTCDSQHPFLSFRVSQHFEAARHTWYIVESCVVMADCRDENSNIMWLAPRRLEHLRRDLHDMVKSTFGERLYARCFEGARFAPHGGLPGTTAHLHRWFDALASCINSKVAPPLVAAVTFRALEAPNTGL
jgi:hypothetical protein